MVSWAERCCGDSERDGDVRVVEVTEQEGRPVTGVWRRTGCTCGGSVGT